MQSLSKSTIAPPPERGQHDRIEVQATIRAGVRRARIIPLHEYYLSKQLIDASQHRAVEMYLTDWEVLSRNAPSSMKSLDRVDFGQNSPIIDGKVREAHERLIRVEGRVGSTTCRILRHVFIDRGKPRDLLKRDRRVSQGMVMLATEILAVAYELKR